jgi:hypothetical protein
MFTGTLISELMTTVEQAELRAGRSTKQGRLQCAGQERIDEELHAIFAMQIPVVPGDQIFMGAA